MPVVSTFGWDFILEWKLYFSKFTNEEYLCYLYVVKKKKYFLVTNSVVFYSKNLMRIGRCGIESTKYVMYRNVLFLNYAQIAINTNVSETKQVGGYLSFSAALQ